jgi:FtsZ-interacting cell division protein ZipA
MHCVASATALSGGQTVLLTLGAAGIGAIAALIGVVFNGIWQGRRERRNYLRQFDERRMAELRDSYAALVRVADTWQFVVRQRKFGLGNETPEERDVRLQKLLSDASEPVQRSVLRLQFEPDAEPILKTFNEAYDQYLKHEFTWSQKIDEVTAKFSPNLVIERADAIRDAETDLSRLVDLLRASVKREVERLVAQIRS